MDDLDTKIPNLIKKPIAHSAASAASRTAARAQEQAQRHAAAQQTMLFVLLGAVLVINMGLAYFFYGIMVQDATRNKTQQLIDHEIDTRIKTVSNFLTENQNSLNQLGQQPIVIQALLEKNQDAIQSLQGSLIQTLNTPLGFTIFSTGSASIDRDAIVPIRFAELDLISRAERRESTVAEAALINDVWQIHFVSAVAADKTQPVLGVLMLTRNIETLKRSFESLDGSLGEGLLQQKFANSIAQTIIKNGTSSKNTFHEKDIPNSHFLIRFTPSDHLLNSGTESATYWLLVMGCSLALSLFLALVLSRFLINKKQNSTQNLAPIIADVEKVNVVSVDVGVNSVYQKQDILDIAVIDEDEHILGLHDLSNKKYVTETLAVDDLSIPTSIFRSYDIRGIVGPDLNAELAEKIGQAIGSEALDQGEHNLIVARDARLHSPELTTALIKGILRSGCNVINIGIVPTPVMYFATYHFEDAHSGVMVTASHNPAEYNGFKIVIKNNALADQAIMELRSRIVANRIHRGIGEESFRDIIPHYIERIFSDVALAGNVSLVIDAGNAVPGIVAPQLFEELGCEVTPLYCELDGTFPHHDPDPTNEKNLQALIAKVQEVNADMGVAFDGDGDRLVVVTPKGDIIWPDRLLMLFAKDVLSRHPGADVLFDVKCSRQLNQVISGYGGRPIMWKTGHSPMKSKMLETGALIGGEYSGHIFIKDRWYGFDDGIYAMARLLEIITLRDQKIDDIFAAFPQLIASPEIKIAVPDQVKFDLMRTLTEKGDFQNGNITTIDGIRVDYSKGWGLVRASNTSPALTLRFEAETEEALVVIKQIFKRELLKVDDSLVVDF